MSVEKFDKIIPAAEWPDEFDLIIDHRAFILNRDTTVLHKIRAYCEIAMRNNYRVFKFERPRTMETVYRFGKKGVKNVD